MAGKGLARLLTRDKLTQGIDVSGTQDGLRIDLHVVVEYGLNLAEVAATVRSRVGYELERLTGLRVAAVEVHIEDVGAMTSCVTELERAKELGQAALATLEANRRRIDDLNVYPVPDGDTGTNLTLTARAIMEVLDASTAADRATLAKELTRAALMGARGNSGVIFSQILRGAAEALGEAGLLDAATIRRAFRAASDAAYRAVRRPVEGTMLSVIRELAEEAEDPRNAALEPAALMKKLIERGEDALARTPDQLAVLREAGVVDAGGAGLLEIVRGVSAALSGEPIPDAPAEAAHEAGLDAVHQELSEFRYCTVFVIEGEGLDAEALEAQLDELGDSLLVVGDATALKIHVHTDEPGRALAFGTALGTIEGVEIANMHKQTEERSERLLDSVPDPG